MPARLAVPETMLESVSGFVTREGIPLDVVPGSAGDVQVVQSAQRQQSTATVLESGGWIACSTALQIAEKLGVKSTAVGKLLDELDIRVRACQLGCFE